MVKKIFFSIIGLFGLVLLIYIMGPKPDSPVYTTKLPVVPGNLTDLESYIRKKEALLPVKPGNEAQIVWANDTTRTQTEYVIIYLHGFSASHEEGNPVHRHFAERFGINLLLTRLADHGLNEKEPMQLFTAERLWQSTLEAYAIGRKLGKKVILMSTSTGGTLSLKLAAEFPEIHSLIMFSPNIEINNAMAAMLNDPWGLQLIQWIAGGPYRVLKRSREINRFWYDRYRLEAPVQLQELLETTMKSAVFKKVKQPVLLLYYYKNPEQQDNVVSVEAMLDMYEALGTPAEQKRRLPVPGAANHVIASYLRSRDVATVEKQTFKFAEEILHLQPVK